MKPSGQLVLAWWRRWFPHSRPIRGGGLLTSPFRVLIDCRYTSYALVREGTDIDVPTNLTPCPFGVHHQRGLRKAMVRPSLCCSAELDRLLHEKIAVELPPWRKSSICAAAMPGAASGSDDMGRGSLDSSRRMRCFGAKLPVSPLRRCNGVMWPSMFPWHVQCVDIYVQPPPLEPNKRNR